ncbi:MAG: cytochrome c biogenesis protein CcsA [Cytophagaceae bacterium]|nr:cytochrome c biogenesis protein CcsA [Cytophagaceae bacterium]
MQLQIGDWGHLFVIISFFSSLVAAFSYYKNVNSDPEDLGSKKSWKRFARIWFGVHAFSVLGIITSLFFIIHDHHYEYHYAWSHSSNHLPVEYMISCFWEGQEGSFLLWIFWDVILGGLLLTINREWEAPVMAVFCAVQAFLASMIIGVVLPFIDLKIGSSPFMLLKEVMPDIPKYANDPNFIPEDGRGLNPLLQNYWMVIHPPTLFLGFATTLVPFAFVVAGLWLKKYKEWIRPALPWALFSALILGTGILMGAYWAYETLNFGGYWNWDPVENAVYVPWLILVASIHTMIIFRNSSAALKTSMILVMSSFLLILYSTFLTRSGILGESSVHSFTDLGLSGQLLIYLLTFIGLTIWLLYVRWKEIPTTDKEASMYSREFWVFMGVTVLSLAAFQVIATTSIPVYNAVLNSLNSIWDSLSISWLHTDSRIAPPVDQEKHYSDWQIWFAIAIALLSGAGQLFWWAKMTGKQIWDKLFIPVLLSLLLATLIILLGGLTKDGAPSEFPIYKRVGYIILLTAAIFSIISNLIIFVSVVKNNIKLTGGAIAHIGVALMLIGILYSSGYTKIISLNNSGMPYRKDFPDEVNAENVLLFRSTPETMGSKYRLTYKGPRVQVEGFPGYINKDSITTTMDPYKVIARRDLIKNGDTYFKKGDTLETNPENTYYEVQYKNKDGKEFVLYPRLQKNPRMGSIPSPDIERFADRDLYSHLSVVPIDEEEREWGKPELQFMRIKDTVFVNDYVAVLDDVERIEHISGAHVDSSDIALKAHLHILGPDGQVFPLHPIYVLNIEEKRVGYVPETLSDLGIRVVFHQINPDQQGFTFEFTSCQRDYIILKAIEKPMINLLWIGSLLLVLGLFIAILRRYNEFAKMKNKAA